MAPKILGKGTERELFVVVFEFRFWHRQLVKSVNNTSALIRWKSRDK